MSDDDVLLAELNDGDTGEFVLTDEYLADKVVPRYVAAARLGTCLGCEFLNKANYSCTVNSWLVAEAAGSNRLACPKGKW